MLPHRNPTTNSRCTYIWLASLGPGCRVKTSPETLEKTLLHGRSTDYYRRALSKHFGVQNIIGCISEFFLPSDHKAIMLGREVEIAVDRYQALYYYLNRCGYLDFTPSLFHILVLQTKRMETPMHEF